MKKIGIIFIFIFLTGLFSGLFFSTNLSPENNDTLSALLLTDFYDPSGNFSHAFFSSVTANLTLVLLMLPALLGKIFCPLPPMLLWYKSFAIGFCCGLVYINASSGAVLISLVKLFPQNLFFIPGFLLLAAILFCISLSGGLRSNLPAVSVAPGRRYAFGHHRSRSHRSNKKSRPSEIRKGLLYALIAAVLLILTGSLTEAVFHLIALSPS
ncbi:MAG: stage II sporulation protein M [Bacillota bacterium]|nr:stage II sporulation protein M [Bacillota bacterium]